MEIKRNLLEVNWLERFFPPTFFLNINFKSVLIAFRKIVKKKKIIKLNISNLLYMYSLNIAV